MRTVEAFNSDWHFHAEFHPDCVGTFRPGKRVRLPHNAIDVPLDSFDETVWHRPFCYQKELAWRPAFLDRSIALRFDGMMADGHVYINGTLAGTHRDGYTPLETSITPYLQPGVNLISVIVDGAQNPEIPPFGGQIDYLTYAGLYRDVWLIQRNSLLIDTIRVDAESLLQRERTLRVRCRLRGADGPVGLRVRIEDHDGLAVAEAAGMARDGLADIRMPGPEALELWDIDTPALYRVTVSLDHGQSDDAISVMTGFRQAEFRPDGFFLNGRKVKIRGLNRHQSWPYVGYAMGRRAQERDAEILKFDLGCNLVRTSHYPQSPWFLDHCDRIGLMVFPEAPGWQHVGGPVWQQQHLRNIEAMIRRDRHHPSIMMWGVRVNESADCNDLYARANACARTLDPSRQTAGVRNLTESCLLEDVYTMNDFIMGQEMAPGANRPRTPLRSREEVTGLDRQVPYLVTEFNGHMYPTRREDHEERQIEHVVRYLEVLNASAGASDIAGCIGWCFADYNTHRDLGAGGICHHGVLDMFRLPKFAAHAYASQRSPADRAVLEPVTYWARGERSMGGVLPLIVLTNCDAVRLQYGSRPPVTCAPDRQSYPHLQYPPVVFTHRDFPDGELGGWGERWQDVTLDGLLDDRTALTRTLVCNPVLSGLTLVPDHWEILASESDEVRVVVTARDQLGHQLHHANRPVGISVRGPAHCLGPTETVLRGGRTAFWIRSTGGRGPVHVEATVPGMARRAIALACVGGEVPT